MKIVYLSNFFNHHQKPLSDQLYELTNGNYYFIETGELPNEQRLLGYQKMTDSYVLKYNVLTKDRINKLIIDADAVICGEAPYSLVAIRYKLGKLTFRDDESRYKHINRYLKWPIYTWQSLYWNRGFLLCASAFACRDYHLSGMSVNKCFKWGYFPETKNFEDIEKLLDDKDLQLKRPEEVSILWVGRLIRFKHPELAIKVAKMLKEKGCPFRMEIIGIGEMQEALKKMITKFSLNDSVKMLGAMPPSRVREHMEKAQIYLFTSDRGEGWGAVLNESMNSGCAVVANPECGAAPYLIEDGKNGLFFYNSNVNSLFEKIIWLVEHPKERRNMGRNAYYSVRDLWSAKNAAVSLVTLIESILKGKESSIKEGPCSKAKCLTRNWYKHSL